VNRNRKDTKMTNSPTYKALKPEHARKYSPGCKPTMEINNAPQSARQEYPEVKAAIERGLADVAAGRVYTRRSYAEYANIETED
jgi:hypothetical protein